MKSDHFSKRYFKIGCLLLGNLACLILKASTSWGGTTPESEIMDAIQTQGVQYQWIDNQGQALAGSWPMSGNWNKIKNSAPNSKNSVEIWIHDSCQNEGVSMGGIPTNVAVGSHQIAMMCHPMEDKIYVTLFWPPESIKLEKTNLVQMNGENITPTLSSQVNSGGAISPLSSKKSKMYSTWLSFYIKASDAQITALPSKQILPLNIGNVTFTSNQANMNFTMPKAVYQLEWMPRPSEQKFTKTAYLGLGFVGYSENPGQTNASMVIMNGGISAKYSLLPKTVDVEGDALITLLPLFGSTSSSSLGSISPPRFYETDIRLSYRFPSPPFLNLGNINFKASLGWEFWGMIVPNIQYGVSLISGPQLIFNVSGELARIRRAWSGYLKYIPIPDSGAVRVGSYILGLGGTFELSRTTAAHPIAVALDITQSSMQFMGVQNQIQLFSIMSGIRYGF